MSVIFSNIQKIYINTGLQCKAKWVHQNIPIFVVKYRNIGQGFIEQPVVYHIVVLGPVNVAVEVTISLPSSGRPFSNVIFVVLKSCVCPNLVFITRLFIAIARDLQVANTTQVNPHGCQFLTTNGKPRWGAGGSAIFMEYPVLMKNH